MVSKSAGKVMPTVVWNTEWMLLIDYKEKAIDITGQHHTDIFKVKKIGEKNGVEVFHFCKVTYPFTRVILPWLVFINTASKN